MVWLLNDEPTSTAVKRYLQSRNLSSVFGPTLLRAHLPARFSILTYVVSILTIHVNIEVQTRVFAAEKL